MSKPSSWRCSFPGAADKIIQFDNMRAYAYFKVRGKVRWLAAAHFGCSFKDSDLKVRLYRPEKKQERITTAAMQRSCGPQSTLELFGVV